MKFLLVVLLIVSCAEAIEIQAILGQVDALVRGPIKGYGGLMPLLPEAVEVVSNAAMLKYARANNYTHQPLFIRSLDTVQRLSPSYGAGRYIKSRMVIGITSCPINADPKVCVPSPRNVQKVQILKFVYLRKYGPHLYAQSVEHAIVPPPKKNQRVLI
ncbi:unnamed protein product [Bursaphelenchus xylophilus]|nr:unnamed protein product [Bursaphelenchus xylophilus]CAG9125118.1 unnamed protein product [Bursaphelenchus xylophilus]